MGTVDVCGTINKLRRQRNFMVQTAVQHVFVYQSLANALPAVLEDNSDSDSKASLNPLGKPTYESVNGPIPEGNPIDANGLAQQVRGGPAMKVSRKKIMTVEDLAPRLCAAHNVA